MIYFDSTIRYYIHSSGWTAEDGEVPVDLSNKWYTWFMSSLHEDTVYSTIFYEI